MKRVFLIVATFIVFIITGYFLSFPCEVKLYIKSCPHHLKVKSKGVSGSLTVAILGGTVGSFFLDADSIDVSTLRLKIVDAIEECMPVDGSGVAPKSWKIKDVATLKKPKKPKKPKSSVEDGLCDCTTKKGHDGFPDLVLKFKKQEIVDAIGDVSDGDIVVLYLSGSMLCGSWIHGWECVIIKKKPKKPKSSNANALGKAVSLGVPNRFYLDQNYPNPFNPETKISYSLPKGSQVRLVIYNLMGQRVQTIVNTFQSAGYYQVIWNGRDNQGRLASSGIYIYRLTAGTFTQTKRMVLLR